MVAPATATHATCAFKVKLVLPQSILLSWVVGIVLQVFTVTTMLLEVVLPHELVVVTEYVPEVVTLMLGLVAFVLQTPPLFPDKVTLPPLQKVVAPPAVIVGAVGSGFTVKVLDVEAVQPLSLLIIHVYKPAVVKLFIVAVLAENENGPLHA